MFLLQAGIRLGVTDFKGAARCEQIDSPKMAFLTSVAIVLGATR